MFVSAKSMEPKAKHLVSPKREDAGEGAARIAKKQSIQAVDVTFHLIITEGHADVMPLGNLLLRAGR